MRRRALAPFLRERAFSGVNVTIPYKRAVMPLCDALSDEAARIGSVNTIVNDGGRLTGYNTDYYGLRRMAEAAGIPFSGRKALILGSGGAARTALAAARDLGAREALLVSRRGCGPDTVDYETACRAHADADVLINATPVGMFPEAGAAPVDLARFPRLPGRARPRLQPAAHGAAAHGKGPRHPLRQRARHARIAGQARGGAVHLARHRSGA